MESRPADEGAAPAVENDSMKVEESASTEANTTETDKDGEVVVISEPTTPAKAAPEQSTSPSEAPKSGSQSGASKEGTSAFNTGTGKKRGRPSKKSLEAAAAGTKGMSAFLVTSAKKAKTAEPRNPAESASTTPPSEAPPESEANNTPKSAASEATACRFLVDGAFVRANIIDRNEGTKQICIQIAGSKEQKWVSVDCEDLTVCGATPMVLDMDREAAKPLQPVSSEPAQQPAEEDVMVIDSNQGDQEPSPVIEKVKEGSSPDAAQDIGKEAVEGGKAGADSVKTPPTAMKKAVKAPKKAAMSEVDKQKQNERLQEELVLLAKMKFSVPCLLPSDQDLTDELNCELNSAAFDHEQSVPMKTRQVVARFVEGSTQTSSELAAGLLQKVVNKPDDTQAVVQRLEEIVCLVGEAVQFCPPPPEGGTEGLPESSCRWNVRDIADIPADFRALVETHHKMQAAVRDRMVHLQRMMGESCPKESARQEKTLLVLKDKFVKLEEKERKEREKLEAKMEKEKEKNEARLEKEKERLEAERKKQEEKDERQRKKEEEKKEKEVKKTDKDVKKTEKAEDEFKPEKPKQLAGKVRADKPKNESTVKQASFMSNFFKKVSAPPAPKPSTAAAEGSSAESLPQKMEVDTETAPAGKAHRNFHPWEAPKNATVATFPYGPGEPKAPSGPAPEGTDLSSWLQELRKEPPRYRKSRPVREDGTEHPKMKLIQLNMKLPLVRTQLVDVDVDAAQKIVWDVEEDNAEEKLAEILAECDETEDGLYKYRGRTLQMLTEGGGWFDCRRPPFHGTVRKISAHIKGRTPLAQDPELDYTYESEVDWESEAGDGEDLGSDLDAEDDEEEIEDDEGGFVVPDGMVMEEEDADGGVATVKRLKKLHQEVWYDEAVSADFASAMAVQLVDSMPLVLEQDENLVVETDADYLGEDLGSAKAANIELAILAVHKHPLACAFTYIPAESDHRFAGVVFLKGKGAQVHKQDGEGLISGFLREVPKSKRIAIRKAAEAEAAEKAAEAAERLKAQKQVPEPKSKRLAKKQEAAAEQAAAAAAIDKHPAPSTTEEAAAKLVEKGGKGKAEKGKSKGGADKAAAAKIAIPDQQLLKLVKLAHGSNKTKAELVRDFLAQFPEVGQSKATRYVTVLFTKKEQRHAIVEERLANPFVAEIAADAWKANVGPPAGAGGAVQTTFRAMPKPVSA